MWLENDAERSRLNAHVDQLLLHEAENGRKTQALQGNQDQMGDWLQKLKVDATDLHHLVYAM